MPAIPVALELEDEFELPPFKTPPEELTITEPALIVPLEPSLPKALIEVEPGPPKLLRPLDELLDKEDEFIISLPLDSARDWMFPSIKS